MNEYVFKVPTTAGIHLYFTATAGTAGEAVRLANEELSEERGAEEIYLGLKLGYGHVEIDPTMRVDESMIIETRPASRDVLLRAHNFLTERGYEGGDVDDLWYDKQPSFMKALYTEDGEGIYGYLRVRASYDLNINQYCFKIDAVLYPTANAQIAEGEGGLYYTVSFIDRQVFTTLDKLPITLEFYESKFLMLIKALRAADPVDGLPLDSESPHF